MSFLLNMKDTYTCGSLDLEFSGMIPYVVSMIVTIIKFAVPVLLVIFGMIDFLKSVSASKEDEIKKGRQTFINRVIAAIIVFFIVYVVQLIVNFASQGDDNIVGCFSCFISGDSHCQVVKQTTKSAGA